MAQARKFKILACVVTYNRPEKLKLVINALKKQTISLDNILVIDNESEIPAKMVVGNILNVSFVRNNTNTGGAGGFAKGILLASKYKADWIWLMDDDAVPRINALEELISVASNINNKTAVLCSAVYEYGEKALVHRRFFNSRTCTERNLPVNAYTKKSIDIDIASFIGFFLRSKVIKAIGLPTKEYFLYYDDTEYSLRIRKHRLKIKLVPKSTINHLCDPLISFKNQFSNKHFYNIRNRIDVYKKYSSFSFLGIIFGIVIGLRILFKTRNLNFKF